MSSLAWENFSQISAHIFRLGKSSYLGFCGLLVKGETSVDLGRDAAGDDGQDLFAEFDELLG